MTSSWLQWFLWSTSSAVTATSSNRFTLKYTLIKHDIAYSTAVTMGTWINISWWRHQMETWNAPVISGFPSQRPGKRSFYVFFDLRLNKRLNKPSRRWWFETPPCSLWRHCNVDEQKALHTLPLGGKQCGAYCISIRRTFSIYSGLGCNITTAVYVVPLVVWWKMCYFDGQLKHYLNSVKLCLYRAKSTKRANIAKWVSWNLISPDGLKLLQVELSVYALQKHMQPTFWAKHYGDAIMGAIASQITSLSHDCLLHRIFRRRSKETIKTPRHWPLCGNSPVTDRWIPRTKGQ